MSAPIWISELQFSDSSVLHIEKNQIVVIVGPNNAGKSATLKETAQMLKQKSQKGKVIHDIKISKDETVDIIPFISKYSSKHYTGNPLPMYSGYGFSIYEGNLPHYWSNYSNGVSELFSVFANILTTEQRLMVANPPSSIRLTTDPIQHPIHLLQKDDSLEIRFSEYFRQAFGTDLVVHRNAGNNVPLYVGKRPVPKEGEDRLSINYLQEIEKMDLLNEQGDGMRSFVGVLLNAFIGNHSILFIDEPEAFLHPPQARLLGKMLAKDFPTDRQILLSTHSEDFLQGLLDSNCDNLKIVRIQRDGNLNRINILDNSDVKEIWSDSLLRHSNVLNGLFHSKVIICESDSDCRFYSAMISSLFDGTTSIAPDVLFIHCGGKHRIPVAIKALRKLNVSIKVITDFDVLNDINPLQSLIIELGGNWDEYKADWQLIKTEIERKRPEYLTSDFKQEIDRIFSETSERILPKDKVKKIESLIKKTSAWSEAKEIGKQFIPSGNATQAFDRIQSKLKVIGLFVLEIGELECFAKSIGNHGPKWVSDVLQKDLKNDPELEYARQFVSQIM